MSKASDLKNLSDAIKEEEFKEKSELALSEIMKIRKVIKNPYSAKNS